jgi:hypothetical protein
MHLKNGCGFGYSRWMYERENYFISGSIDTFVYALDQETYRNDICFSIQKAIYTAGFSSWIRDYSQLSQNNR